MNSFTHDKRLPRPSSHLYKFDDFFESHLCAEYISQICEHLEDLYGIEDTHVHRKYVQNHLVDGERTYRLNFLTRTLTKVSNKRETSTNASELPSNIDDIVSEKIIVTSHVFYQVVIELLLDVFCKPTSRRVYEDSEMITFADMPPLMQYAMLDFYMWSSPIAARFIKQKKPIDRDIVIWYDFDFMENFILETDVNVKSMIRDQIQLLRHPQNL